MERIPDHPIEELFTRRWSPRAMSGEPVSQEDLMRLFEAARWAPSSGNAQPWRFVYARAGTPHFERLLGLLVEANRAWCAKAGALIVILSKKTSESGGRPLPTHSFDAGAAWMSLALQGSQMGLVTHGMAGFDYGRARVELAVPDDVAVDAMVAVGHSGRVEDLPEKYQSREVKSSRRPVAESVFEGTFV